MKSLAWIETENREIEARIAKKHADAVKRLKQRIANAIPWDQTHARRNALAAVDAWAEAEKKRSGR